VCLSSVMSVCLSVFLPACSNSRIFEQIFMKYDFEEFY
jgi:hypothetical protein